MKKFNVTVNNKTYAVEVEEVEKNYTFTHMPIQKVQTKEENIIHEQNTTPKPQDDLRTKHKGMTTGETIAAPMPGTILEIKVSEGQNVKAGDIVAILEAMKMENELAAPVEGIVTSIYTNKGETVNAGDSILSIE